MQDLLKKIEASAEARLPLPPGKTATQELARYKAFLKVESHRLKIAHRAGGGGIEICRARAAILDLLLRSLWDAAVRESFGDEKPKLPLQLSLIAIGGYGRAELNPHSDIDFMFLHNKQVSSTGKPLPQFSKLIDGILYPLWDIGLKVGHSVRTLEDCARVANSDMQSKTSLIESRLLVGNESLFKLFQNTVIARCVQGHQDEYIAMRLADQNARREKYGNSATMQEPNIKNGCGGLRDYQNLLWMAFFKYRTRTLKELQKKDFVGEPERESLEEAYDFLMRVRTEMHYHTNRATDQLTKALQPAVAHNLGYTDRSPSVRIEKFMRDVYTHSRNIFLITRTLERRMALLPQPETGFTFRSLLPSARRALTEPVDGFKFISGEIVATSPRVFRDQPRRLMRVFLHAQQRGLQLHPDLAQLIRSSVSLVDREFLADPHIHETFLAILNQRGNVGPILRMMHEVDFLGKYVPEFGKLTCLVQHEFYHQYAADEHTLVCLEQLDRVWEANTPPYSNYAALFQAVERPYLLYLALLLHDTGKPTGHGHHAEVSAQLALRFAKRIKLDAAATETLRAVIEHHLLMAQVSQRRDLEDPNVIRAFAKEVPNVETLTLLTLLTFADTLATSEKLWNGFKDALIRSLYGKTLAFLSGSTEFIKAEEKQRELAMSEIRRVLHGNAYEEELQAHFSTLPSRYFLTQSARDVTGDVLLAHRFLRLQISDDGHPLTPVVNWHNDPDLSCNTVKVCTWDRAGLFNKIAGSLSAAGLNILSAQIFTRVDGIVLDTFYVTDAVTGNLAEREQRDTFENLLDKILTGAEVNLKALISRQKISRPPYQAYSGERIPTVIHFDNEASETRTLLEIETEDRLGLLYAISLEFAKLNIDISTAKIVTEKGAAIDSFYVSEAGAGKIVSPDRLNDIERRLRAAIKSLDVD